MPIAEELAAVLGRAVAEHGTPGAAVGVLVGDDVHTASCGVTHVEHPQAVGPATLFQVGSITKTFTSAAVMVLVEEGALALEDPVGRYLPDLGAATGLDFEAISVERALSHQAGFDGDHLFVQREEDIEALAGARRLFPPGGGFSYNNAGFSVVGAVIEAVAGQSFESFLRARLLRPLGLVSATFRADEAITNQVAMPHWVFEGIPHVLRKAGWQPGWELGPVDRPAGGLVASVEHLLAWCRFQRTGTALDGTAILQPESLRRLHTPVVQADCVEGIALDWSVRTVDGVRSIGHGGTTAGYQSDLVIVPECDVAFVALTNATNGSSVIQAVRRWALERFSGMKERDPEPDTTVAVDPSRFAGSFVHPFARLTVTASEESNRVVVTSTKREDVDGWQPPLEPPLTLAFFAADHAVTVDAAGPARIARFGFDMDGRAEWLLWGGRRAPRTD